MSNKSQAKFKEFNKKEIAKIMKEKEPTKRRNQLTEYLY
jgi:hypothetical protein